MLFLIAYCLPLLVEILFIPDTPWIWSCFAMTSSFALHEMWRFKELRKSYLNGIWGVMDCLQVVAFYLYLGLKSLNKSLDSNDDTLGTQSIFVLIALMKTFLITHCFVKVIYYLRIYDNVR